MSSRFSRFSAQLVAVFAGLAASIAMAQPSPIAHYTFDDGLSLYDTATVDDATGNNVAAAWQDEVDGELDFSGLGYTAGQIGGAINLRGSADEFFQVDVINELTSIQAVDPDGVEVPVVGTGFSVSAWINLDADATFSFDGVVTTRTATDVVSGTVSSADQNYGLNIENPAATRVDSRFSGGPGGGLDSADGSIVAGQWHLLTLVWGIDGDVNAFQASSNLYIDGVRVASELDSINELVASGAWEIGDDSIIGGREFDGLIDDVAFFDVALTEGDVSSLYNNGLAGVDASGTSTGLLDIADVDGVDGVQIEDYFLIRDNLGQDVNSRLDGDVNGDRRVDLVDFQLWLDNAPEPIVAQALAATAPVPEPGTAVLVSLFAMTLIGSTRASRA